MKRYTKEQIMEGILCGEYYDKLDKFFARHKTATLLNILNARGIEDEDKEWIIWWLDEELVERAEPDDGDIKKLLANIRKELKNEKME